MYVEKCQMNIECIEKLSQKSRSNVEKCRNNLKQLPKIPEEQKITKKYKEKCGKNDK